jgi:hypothetical protein
MYLIYKNNNGVCLSICLTNKAGAGQGRAARADTRPLDLLAIYRILGENRGTYIYLKKYNFLKKLFSL